MDTEEKYCAPNFDTLSIYPIETGADVKIIFGDDPSQPIIDAHMCILVTRSKYFRVALGSTFKESKDRTIQLPIEYGPYFGLVLKFIYTGKIHMDLDEYEDHLLKYIEIADYLGISDLSKKLSEVLIVGENNLMEILEFSTKLPCQQEIGKKISYYFEENLARICQNTPDLLNKLLEGRFKEIIIPIIIEKIATLQRPYGGGRGWE